MYFFGTPGISLDRFSLRRKTGSSSSNISGSSFDNNNICRQEVHGKDEFLQAIQVWAPRFKFFGIFILSNENAGGSAICIHKDFLLEDATVTHDYMPRP